MKHPNFSQSGIKQIRLFCIIIMYYTKIFLGVVSVNFKFQVNIYLYTTLILIEVFLNVNSASGNKRHPAQAMPC